MRRTGMKKNLFRRMLSMIIVIGLLFCSVNADELVLVEEELNYVEEVYYDDSFDDSDQSQKENQQNIEYQENDQTYTDEENYGSDELFYEDLEDDGTEADHSSELSFSSDGSLVDEEDTNYDIIDFSSDETLFADLSVSDEDLLYKENEANVFENRENIEIVEDNIEVFNEELVAEDVSYANTSGVCGHDVRWRIEKDDFSGATFLIISGTGEMYNYDHNDDNTVYTPWNDYYDDIAMIIIEDGVTTLGSLTFFDCWRAESISIPRSINHIYSEALPFEIFNNIFYAGSKQQWEHIQIDGEIHWIGEPHFYYNNLGLNVRNNKCGNNITWSISNETLYLKGSGQMTNYSPEREMAPWLSLSYGIKHIVVGDGITSIGDYAFSDLHFGAEIKMPDSITRIGNSAFKQSYIDAELELPKEVETIGNYAFYDTNISKITLGSKVSKIGESAFAECNNLKEVYYYGSENSWKIIAIGNNNESLINILKFVDNNYETNNSELFYFDGLSLNKLDDSPIKIVVGDTKTIYVAHIQNYTDSNPISFRYRNSNNAIADVSGEVDSKMASKLTTKYSMSNYLANVYSIHIEANHVGKTVLDVQTSDLLIASKEIEIIDSFRVEMSGNHFINREFEIRAVWTGDYLPENVKFESDSRKLDIISIYDGTFNKYSAGVLNTKYGYVIKAIGKETGTHEIRVSVDGQYLISFLESIIEDETGQAEEYTSDKTQQRSANAEDEKRIIAKYQELSREIDTYFSEINKRVKSQTEGTSSTLEIKSFDQSQNKPLLTIPEELNQIKNKETIIEAAYYALSIFFDNAKIEQPYLSKLDSKKMESLNGIKLVNEIKDQWFDFKKASIPYKKQMITNIHIYGYANALMGEINVDGHTFVVVSSQESAGNTMLKYYQVINDVLEEYIINSLKEYFKVFGNITDISSIMEETYKDSIGNIYEFVKRKGLGDLSRYAMYMYKIKEKAKNFTKSLKNARSISDIQKIFIDAEDLYTTVHSYDFSDKSVKDDYIKEILERIKKRTSELDTMLYNYVYHPERSLEKEKSFWDGIVDWFGGSGGKCIKVECPVDVYIYDINESQIGYATDNRCDFKSPLYIHAENDRKTILIPNGITVVISIISTGDGAMTYTIDEYDEKGLSNQIKYNDIPLNEGINYKQEIYSEKIHKDQIPSLINEQTNTIYSAVEYEEKIRETSYSVSCEIEGNGVVIGSGSFGADENATLLAVADNENIFEGWYENGIKIENDNVLTIEDKKSHSIKARFIKSTYYYDDEQYDLEENETKITLSRNSVIIYSGTSTTINATIVGLSNTVTWLSSDNSIATVKDGKITGIKAGTATITAEANGKMATCEVTVKETEVVKSGTCGDDLTWKLTGVEGNMTLNIYGSGKMENYLNYNDSPWYAYCSSIVKVMLPEEITSIGNRAFEDCKNLTSITIPNSVKSIGDYAFKACYRLNSITIPDSVTSIGNYAFKDCLCLLYITISNSVTSISDSTFDRCINITSITIPNSVTSIDEDAFKGCSHITIYGVKGSVAEIFANKKNIPFMSIPAPEDNEPGVVDSGSCGHNLIWKLIDENGNMTLTISGSGEMVDFYYNSPWNAYCSSIVKVMLPEGITNIGSYAFRKCSNLTSITIPNSVMSIGDRAFYDCYGLSRIIIPDSVMSIGYYAFNSCSSLTSIVIPDSVTSIGRGAFHGCSSLTSITIPNSVTSIGEDAFYKCDKMTFYGYSGSYAEKYAKKNNISFKPLDPEPSLTASDLSLNKTSATLYTPGAAKTTSFTLKASTKRGKITSVSFKSSNTSVATVNKTSGKVISKKAGTSTITATVKAKNGSDTVTAKLTCKVTVNKPTLTVSPTSVSLKKGKSKTLTVKTTPSATVTYTSSNKKIATVSNEGTITTKKKGSCKITVKCNGITKTVKVTVK